MRKSRRISTPVYDEIVRLAAQRWGPAEILRELGNLGFSKADIPSLPTIRDVWREVNPPDNSGPWTVLSAAPDVDSELVLTVLREVVIWSEGHINSLSIAEARAVTSVKRAAPYMRGALLWAISREYIRRSIQEAEMSDLNLLLAINPWTDAAGRDLYHWAVKARLLPDDTLEAISKTLEELEVEHEPQS